jgi:nucleoside-diphosphate-sugar epimerase
LSLQCSAVVGDDMNRILLTGASGIVGGHLRRHLARLAPDCELRCLRADLTESAQVEAEVRGLAALGAVVHLAALVPVDVVRAQPGRAYAVNVGGTATLLAALQATGQRPYLFLMSSSHVYAPSAQPIGEDGAIGPATLYGRTKWLAEEVCRDVCGQTRQALGIGRVFSIHDPAQTGSFLRPSLERRLAAADPDAPFELPGADSLRDFLTAEAAAERIARLVLRRFEGVINIASGKGTRVRDFAEALAGRPLNVVTGGGSDCLVADVSRLRAILGDDA